MSQAWPSPDFFATRGVTATKQLRDWLARASHVSRARATEGDRLQYDMWVRCQVEDAIVSPGGIASVDWVHKSAVKPVGYVAPPTVQVGLPNGPSGSQLQPPGLPNDLVARQALWSECERRCPQGLQPFLEEAFRLYDSDVQRGKRLYSSVTFVEMLNIATNLHRRQQSNQPPEVPPTAAPPTRAPIHVNANPFPGTVIGWPSLAETAPAGGSHTPAALSKEACAPNTFASDTRNRGAPRGICVPNNARAAPESRKRAREAAGSAGAWRPGCSFLPEGCVARMCDGFVKITAETSDARNTKPFVGRSVELERKYSRYEPTAEDIRPLPVLQKAFKHVSEKYSALEKVEGTTAATKYLSEQLKGMRQDIHVQSIRNFFTIVVYETHARVALRMGDLGEFNQCQAALKGLYNDATIPKVERASVSEFVCYRLLYLMLGEQYDVLAVELMDLSRGRGAHSASHRSGGAAARFSQRPTAGEGLQRLPPRSAGLVTDSDSQWTMRLCAAFEEGNGVLVTKCLAMLPRGTRLLLAIFLQRYRIRCLGEQMGAFRGLVAVPYILLLLGFTPAPAGDGAGAGAAAPANPPPGKAARRSKKQRQGSAHDLLTDPSAAWADGSLKESEEAFRALLATIKVDFTPQFDYQRGLLTALQRRCVAMAPVSSGGSPCDEPRLTAEEVLGKVQQYLVFLRTRSDARHASDGGHREVP